MQQPAGERGRRIRIERASTIRDPKSGERVPSWTLLAERWASWRPASARETLAAAEVSAQVTDVFELLWSTQLADLNPKDRLIFKGRVYDIAGVIEIGCREGIRITATARSDAA
jgi:SPP1 family predicted phage head-tail adaptor